MPERRTIAEGRHLELVDVGGWEYVHRTQGTGVVMIVGVTDDDRLLLIEQYRPPIGTSVIEVPAGLVGDDAGADDEDFCAAARRELREETGYDAAEIERVAVGCTSPGLCDEMVTVCVARRLTRVGPGGGDGSEDITVHEVPLAEVREWLAERVAAGATVDLKVYSAAAWASPT